MGLKFDADYIHAVGSSTHAFFSRTIVWYPALFITYTFFAAGVLFGYEHGIKHQLGAADATAG